MTGRMLSRLRRGSSFILNQVRGRAAILLYHRIANHVPDAQLLCVRPDYFREHLDLMRRHYHLMSLDELRVAIGTNSIPRRSVVITLDDGYADNLYQGKPILQQYDCPATVYVTSGFVGGRRELLSDEIERVVLSTQQLPESLDLSVQGKSYQWELGREGSQCVAWDVTASKDPSRRHQCYRALHRLLTPLPQHDREAALTELFRWSGNERIARADRRLMNSNELRQLVDGGLIEVGAHTVHHLALARQPVAEQRAEIFGSRKALEEILGRPVASFAYPYGDPSSIGGVAQALAMEAGFLSACANSQGLVVPQNPLFALPRFMVRNWSGAEFAMRMNRFFCT